MPTVNNNHSSSSVLRDAQCTCMYTVQYCTLYVCVAGIMQLTEIHKATDRPKDRRRYIYVLCMSVCVNACMYVYMYLCVCVCAYVHVCVYACMCVCECMYVCMYVCTYACMYV